MNNKRNSRIIKKINNNKLINLMDKLQKFIIKKMPNFLTYRPSNILDTNYGYLIKYLNNNKFSTNLLIIDSEIDENFLRKKFLHNNTLYYFTFVTSWILNDILNEIEETKNNNKPQKLFDNNFMYDFNIIILINKNYDPHSLIGDLSKAIYEDKDYYNNFTMNYNISTVTLICCDMELDEYYLDITVGNIKNIEITFWCNTLTLVKNEKNIYLPKILLMHDNDVWRGKINIIKIFNKNTDITLTYSFDEYNLLLC